MAELLRSESNLKPSELKAAFKRSQHIDALLDQERERKSQEIQLLTLGSGNSGKSTFIKQLKIVYDDGFNEKERLEYRPQVYRLLAGNIAKITRAVEQLGLHFNSHDVKAFAEDLSAETDDDGNNNNSSFTPLGKHEILSDFWGETAVQECFESRARFHIDESSKHFFTDIKRVSGEDYVPTQSDILLVRNRTQGVIERSILVNNYNYRVIDVGGQKNQRKKWIHFFDGVTAVVFFASLSSYDEQLEEEEDTNAMLDSLDLFEEITHCEFLANTQFILFLNKLDLFNKKLSKSDLSNCFPEFKGGTDPGKALEYVKEQFMSRKPADKHIYVHVTCATETDPMKPVLEDVFEILVGINLKRIASL
ncbi:guanine nucleotide-binding protein G(o) subunit alpha [Nematostella vectensis]|uniref:guanine nucleotide-binding protein G(o) subunit alpha n=1 Tax=Nematostella vectensis TaxID=45351 RepID=UPI00138FEFBB|nr:guanine nucleotide-binding protein G(o) subunit alpha [Nematostella vectensis]